MERVPIKRILCPTDFSEASVRAYEYAFSVARRYGAELVVQHAIELWKHPCATFAASAEDYNRFCSHLSNSARAKMHDFIQYHSPDGYAPECLVQEGPAVDCILLFAEKAAIDLIVIGAHGIRGSDRFVLGSVTEKVLRKAHCPVLVVHETFGDPTNARPFSQGIALKEILFCTDFSAYANRAFDYAHSVAEEYNANLTLLHVVDGLSLLHREENIEKADRFLKQLIPPSLRQDHRVRTIVRSGSAYREICKLALEKKVDLAIMAVHGRNALDLAVFGSTTYRVVQSGSCPVLAVHSQPIESRHHVALVVDGRTQFDGATSASSSSTGKSRSDTDRQMLDRVTRFLSNPR